MKPFVLAPALLCFCAGLCVASEAAREPVLGKDTPKASLGVAPQRTQARCLCHRMGRVWLVAQASSLWRSGSLGATLKRMLGRVFDRLPELAELLPSAEVHSV